MNKLSVPDDEKIDLFDDNLDIKTEREKVSRLIACPQDACRYCDSFDAENGTRFKAGEQLKKG